MFARFFIERPVLANVIACVIMLLGAVAVVFPLRMLPPYILTEKEVDHAIKGLSKIFKNGKPE